MRCMVRRFRKPHGKKDGAIWETAGVCNLALENKNPSGGHDGQVSHHVRGVFGTLRRLIGRLYQES